MIRIEAAGEERPPAHLVTAIVLHLRERWNLACRNCSEPSYSLFGLCSLDVSGDPDVVSMGSDHARTCALVVCDGCGESRTLDLRHAGIDPSMPAPTAGGETGPYR